MVDKLKIGVFAYNFKHKKTQEGLLHLFLNDYDVTCVLAADPVKLNFYTSKIRIAPKDIEYLHPRDIAHKLDIPYHVVVHNSQDCIALVKKYNLDLGIVLGARIIKQDVIDSFNIGVLNMHPGMLPQNRGLDNLKWAILNNFKQGVSCHLIDSAVDRGNLIIKKEIDVYQDDTLIDVHLRLQNLELELMIESLKILESGKRDFEPVEDLPPRKSVGQELEKKLMQKFEDYKKNYRK